MMRIGDSMIFVEENCEKCSVRAVKVNNCMRKFAFGHFLGGTLPWQKNIWPVFGDASAFEIVFFNDVMLPWS